MRASETLTRAYEAMLRVYEIEDTLESLRGKIGGSSDGLSIRISKGTVLDPTRAIDALMVMEPKLERERGWCQRDILEGRRICRGAKEVMGPSASKALELWYCDGWTEDAIAGKTGYTTELVKRIVAEGPTMLDGYDYLDLRNIGMGMR